MTRRFGLYFRPASRRLKKRFAAVALRPFGLNSRQMWSWLHSGGGREALEPVYRDQGVHGIPAGNSGALMGGWSRKEVRAVQDLQGFIDPARVILKAHAA